MHASRSSTPARRSPLSAAILGALVLFCAGPALAQDATATDAAPQANDKAAELDQVIVTANKRPEDARNVASSISVIGAAQLQDMQATQLSDYSSYVPGLQVSSNGTPGQTTVSLRGIAPLSSSATVGTYIDEAPVGSNGIYQAATIFMLDLLPYDIDHIEVLRGPQGTLYGAGSMGGLLKYVMRQPDLSETGFRVGGGFSGVDGGNHGSDFRFGANLPLSKDRLGLRLSYARNNIPGYIDNAVDGSKDINGGAQTSARAALLWQGDGIDLKLTAMRQSIDSDNNAAVSLDPATGKPIGGDLAHLVYVDAPFRKDIDYYAATLDWNLGWADFTSASGYSDIDTMRRQDTTVDYGQFTNLGLGLADPGSSYYDNTLSFHQFTQEFRLSSKSGNRLEWLLGVFYDKETGDNHQHIALNQIDGSPLPSPYDAIAGDLATLHLPTDYKETAVFANAAYRFTDRFKVGAGVRYAKNEQHFSQIVESGLLLPIGNDPSDSSESVVTWSLTPQFQLSKDTLLYAKVATGYQPGGPNVLLPGVPPQVDSSTLTSYEAGIKATLADNRVQIDAAAYRLDWKDIQVVSTFNGASGLVNGGTARSQGFELAASYRPSANLKLGLNAAYTDADLSEDFPTLQIPSPPYLVLLNSGLAGDRMPYTPKFSAALTFDYFFPVGGNGWDGHVGGGFRWVGDRVAGTSQLQVIVDAASGAVLQSTLTPPLKLDSYGALDLYAGVENEHWSIRAFLKNATDERAYSSISSHQDQLTKAYVENVAVPIQPRTFGLEFDYSF